MTVFVGIDLAWAPANPSGICVLSQGSNGLVCDRLTAAPCTSAELVRVCSDAGEDVVVAVDAPLHCVNELGRRACEVALAKVFGRYHAGPHSFNLEKAKTQRAGLDLCRLLDDVGFATDPMLLGPRAAGRFVFEAFPHPSHVVLFGLDKSIPYKARKGRDADFRRGHFAFYQDCLRALILDRWPSLMTSPDVARMLSPDSMRAGRAPSKALEDAIDALSCALIAAVAWECGVARGDVFGNEDGHIAVPGLSRDPRFAPSVSADAVQ